MMKSRECRATRQEIDQAEAGARLSAQGARHVVTCAPCAAFQTERTRLRELLSGLEPVSAPADFDFRLRARIAAQAESSGPRSFLAGFVLSTPAMAVATMVVVMLGLSILWMSQRNTNQPRVIATNSSSQSGAGKLTTSDSSTTTKPLEVRTPITSGRNEEAAYRPRVDRRPQRINRTTQSGGYSSDFSAIGAQSIKRGQNASDVSVSAPLNPMVLSFQDEKGGTRTVSLPPVSFGSQRLLESRAVPVSVTNSRVW